MGAHWDETWEHHRRDVFHELTSPKKTDLPMRELVIEHATRIVTDHDEKVQAKLHFVNTGEVLREDIRAFTAFISPGDLKQKAYVTRALNNQLMPVPDFTGLSDADVLAEYGALLLVLREHVLPDPLPA